VKQRKGAHVASRFPKREGQSVPYYTSRITLVVAKASFNIKITFDEYDWGIVLG